MEQPLAHAPYLRISGVLHPRHGVFDSRLLGRSYEVYRRFLDVDTHLSIQDNLRVRLD